LDVASVIPADAERRRGKGADNSVARPSERLQQDTRPGSSFDGPVFRYIHFPGGAAEGNHIVGKLGFPDNTQSGVGAFLKVFCHVLNRRLQKFLRRTVCFQEDTLGTVMRSIGDSRIDEELMAEHRGEIPATPRLKVVA
jgi:hypothetical protein